MFHALAVFLCAFGQVSTAGGPPEFDDAHQILWQRNLDDALAISKAEQRPLLIAINADGESASERIVRERYRDPQFVETTRRFVCVAASYFRHTPRDYDDQGRRIACPRLGEVTCGEHIALEPATHDAYLEGIAIELFGETTERVSPRHVLVQPDGTKSFDMYLLFDFRDLDKALAEWSAKAPALDAKAATNARNNRARSEYERALLQGDIREAWKRFDQDTRFTKDPGWADALRFFLPHAPQFDERMELNDRTQVMADQWPSEVVSLVEWTKSQARVADVLRERLLGAGSPAGVPGTGKDVYCLPMLAEIAPDQPGTRTLLMSYLALGSEGAGGGFLGHKLLEKQEQREQLVSALVNNGGPFDPLAFFERVRSSPPASKFAPKIDEPLPDAIELEAALTDADAIVSENPADADAQAKLGLAALKLARRRIQDGGSGIGLLLEDARAALEKASKSRPNDLSLLLERARAANLTSRFDEQEQIALQASAAAGVKLDDSVQALAHNAVEALRWLGDACARRLGERSGKDPVDEALGMLRGARAFALAAASDDAYATDWLSLASFFGALGRSRERIAFGLEGLRRFPADNALRTEVTNALWSVGRPDLVVSNYEWIARASSRDAASQWYAGYALVLQAESLRRGEDPDAAIAAYERSAPYFRAALALEPNFKDSSEHYLALGALGKGFAHLLVDRRDRAAQCVVEAAAIRPAIMSVRDGLDREGVDLIDGVLEWHMRGDNSLDANLWLEQLQRASPGNAYWARSISDSELREGFRALGRADDASAARYFDAAIAAARAAHSIEASEANTQALAQALTSQAERLLEAKPTELEPIRVLLNEAARLTDRTDLGLDVVASDLAELAAGIRASLGAARPVLRPGR